MIFEAKLEVDELHVVVCSETERDQKLLDNSRFTLAVTAEDRVHWAKSILSAIPGISVHHLNEDGIPSYPNGWEAWTERVKELLAELKISPTHIFSSEKQDKEPYERLFKLPVRLIDPPRENFPISATKIRNEPYKNWAFIPEIVRPYFTYHVVISDSIPAFPLLKSLFESTNAGAKMVEIIPFSQVKDEPEAVAPLYILTPEDSDKLKSFFGSRIYKLSPSLTEEEQYQTSLSRILDYLKI